MQRRRWNSDWVWSNSQPRSIWRLSQSASTLSVPVRRDRFFFFLMLYWNPKTVCLLLSHFGKRFHGSVMHVLSRGMWNPTFGHFGHLKGKTHVRLLKLYWISLSLLFVCLFNHTVLTLIRVWQDPDISPAAGRAGQMAELPPRYHSSPLDLLVLP